MGGYEMQFLGFIHGIIVGISIALLVQAVKQDDILSAALCGILCITFTCYGIFKDQGFGKKWPFKVEKWFIALMRNSDKAFKLRWSRPVYVLPSRSLLQWNRVLIGNLKRLIDDYRFFACDPSMEIPSLPYALIWLYRGFCKIRTNFSVIEDKDDFCTDQLIWPESQDKHITSELGF